MLSETPVGMSLLEAQVALFVSTASQPDWRSTGGSVFCNSLSLRLSILQIAIINAATLSVSKQWTSCDSNWRLSLARLLAKCACWPSYGVRFRNDGAAIALAFHGVQLL